MQEIVVLFHQRGGIYEYRPALYRPYLQANTSQGRAVTFRKGRRLFQTLVPLR